jgi:Bacterial Ig-like domain (group 3)/Dockerin type I domain
VSSLDGGVFLLDPPPLANPPAAGSGPVPPNPLVNGDFNEGANNLDGWTVSDSQQVMVSALHQAVLRESPSDIEVDLHQDFAIPQAAKVLSFTLDGLGFDDTLPSGATPDAFGVDLLDPQTQSSLVATVDSFTNSYYIQDVVDGISLGQGATGAAVAPAAAPGSLRISLDVSGLDDQGATLLFRLIGGSDVSQLQGAVGISDVTIDGVTTTNTTLTAAVSQTAMFSTSNQTATLSAMVTSAVGPVNEGTVTFSVFNSSSVLIGTAVTSGTVSSGVASAVYTVPGNTPVGTYTIVATYNPGADFLTSSSNTHTLTVNSATTSVTAGSQTASFSTSNQPVTLSAMVTSAASPVNEGTVTFSVFNNSSVLIGTAVTSGTVSANAASVSYTLPGNSPAGTYTIVATYNPGADFLTNSDNTHTLTIDNGKTSVTATNPTANFSTSDQPVMLSAAVTSAAGPINEGTVTFSVFNSSSVLIGTAVTSGTVSANAASTSYRLPGNSPAGTYTIVATYNPGADFLTSSDNTHTLTVNKTNTNVNAANQSASFSTSNQLVTLSAAVTSAAGPINEGTVTFSVFNSSSVLIGTAVTSGTVSANTASINYTLPGNSPAGTYTIVAAYNPGVDFLTSSDITHALIVNSANTSIAAANQTAGFSTSDQPVMLSAMVTSASGPVTEGTVTFSVFNSSSVLIGTPVTSGTVSANAASASYTLPGNSPAGMYTIVANYNPSADFKVSSDNTHTLTVDQSKTSATAVSVVWGGQSILVQTAADGVRLLPVGRAMDLPWSDISGIAMSLGQPAAVAPGDVIVTGSTGGNYGPVTITGSGTSNITIVFKKIISSADRVTFTIGNAQISTLTRRLDVLPGDAKEDGQVNVTDAANIIANYTATHAYQQVYDLNGDGVVNATDITVYLSHVGNTLPAISAPPAQLAAGGEGISGAPLLTPAQLDPVFMAAINQWAAAGIPAQDVAKLHNVTVQITNALPASYLGGTAIGGSVVYISVNAAGHGWDLDGMRDGSGRADLLTVVAHELGHALGLYDLDPVQFANDIMTETLAAGIRRRPSAQDVIALTTLPREGAGHPDLPSVAGRWLSHRCRILRVPNVFRSSKLALDCANKRDPGHRARHGRGPSNASGNP